MSTLPGNIATPTLVTGKTDKSQVIDVYENSGIEARAQNAINSVLNAADGTILESTKNAAVKLISADRFYGDLGGVINKFAKGGFTEDALKSALKDYKSGALNTILEANGVKDLDSLKDNLLGAVQNNVKDFAFGAVKGFTDNLSPGLLDQVGVKSFSDAKKLYDNMDAMVNDLKNMNTEAWIDQGLGFVSALTPGVVEKTLSLIDETMGEGNLDIKVKDTELDNAIMTGICSGLVVENNPVVNDFIFSSFGDLTKEENAAKLEMFVSTSTANAAAKGSTDFLIKAAEKTSSSFVRSNLGGMANEFLKNMQVPKATNNTEREKIETDIIKSLSVITGKVENELDLGVFNKLSDAAKDILKYSTKYGADVAVAGELVEFTPDELTKYFPDYFPKK